MMETTVEVKFTPAQFKALMNVVLYIIDTEGEDYFEQNKNGGCDTHIYLDAVELLKVEDIKITF